MLAAQRAPPLTNTEGSRRSVRANRVSSAFGDVRSSTIFVTLAALSRGSTVRTASTIVARSSGSVSRI
jgi:hypothetical protein